MDWRTGTIRTIAVVTQKGGAGKTTVALNLAVAATTKRHRVLVLDLDPQRTALAWYEQREQTTPAVVAIDPDTASRVLPDALARAKSEAYDLVLIDTPGRDALAVNAAMRAADLCLIVTRPTVADLRAQWATVEALKKFPGKRAAFVMNQCHHNGRRAEIVRRGALAAFPFSALPVFLSQRTEYQDAYARALGVTECATGSAAAREVDALWKDVQRQLEKRIDA
jgi:chromosome partitioning protein